MARRRSSKKKDEAEAPKDDVAPAESEAEEATATEEPLSKGGSPEGGDDSGNSEPGSSSTEDGDTSDTGESSETDADSEGDAFEEAPKDESEATTELGDSPTFEEVKAFVKGGGTIPPAMISHEWLVEEGTMVKLQGLAPGSGHPKLVIPAKKK